jgi:predicted adenylyl cyclase CyaB
MFEIEYKYRLPNDAEEGRVRALLAHYGPPVQKHETDYHGMVGDKYLRLREEIRQGRNPVHKLILKDKDLALGALQPKARKELEIRVDHDQTPVIMEMLDLLCDKILPPVVKTRYYYRIDDIVVTIDEVNGLGTFIEIEAISDHLNSISKIKLIADEVLELRPEWQVSKSYGELIKQKEEEGG